MNSKIYGKEWNTVDILLDSIVAFGFPNYFMSKRLNYNRKVFKSKHKINIACPIRTEII